MASGGLVGDNDYIHKLPTYLYVLPTQAATTPRGLISGIRVMSSLSSMEWVPTVCEADADLYSGVEKGMRRKCEIVD